MPVFLLPSLCERHCILFRDDAPTHCATRDLETRLCVDPVSVAGLHCQRSKDCEGTFLLLPYQKDKEALFALRNVRSSYAIIRTVP